MGESPPAWAEIPAGRIRTLAPVHPQLSPGKPDLASPPGAEPLIADAGLAIGWTALDDGRGAVGLDYGVRFDLDLRAGRAEYRSAPTVSGELVADSWERCALPFALASAGTAVLHAAAVSDGHAAVALVGPSGTGKSTLRTELQRFGYRPYADDALAIAADSGAPRALFLPFRPKAGPAGFDGPRLERPGAGEDELPLRAVVLLTSGEGFALRRLEGGEAFEALLENSYSLPGGGGAPPATEELLAIAGRVPVFELRLAQTGRAEPATAGALLSVLRGSGLWGGRALLRADRKAMVAAVPMAVRYRALRLLGPRLAPGTLTRIALAPRRPRLPLPSGARSTGLARLRAASALFPPGSACLERSFALARALTDGGLDPEVVVGWSLERAEGHAWVELEGVPVLDDALPERSFAELWRCNGDGQVTSAEG